MIKVVVSVDFTVKNLAVLDIFGVEVWITETHRNTWIIMAALIILAILGRIALRNFKEVPSGAQNVIETVIEMFDSLVRGAAGEKFMFLGNWFFMVFTFLLVSNISGLFLMRPPTADFVTTFGFAFSTFMLIQIIAVSKRGPSYFLDFVSPNPVFLPLNIIGELARPISLSFRLFGNILAGMILMSLLYALAPIFVRFLIPVPLHAFFDLFAGSLQAYIFCVLSMTFISVASSVDEG